jgi:tetratricopeptide (TPR) repeat protein
MSNHTRSIDISAKIAAKAKILRQGGNIPLAIEILSQGIKLAPQKKMLYYALTEALLDGEHYQAALDIIEKFDSHEMGVRQAELKGICLEKLQRYQEAEQVVDHILGQSHSSASALNLKGLLLFHKKELQRAETYFERAIKSDSKYGEACMNLGLLKLEIGDSRNALCDLHQGFILSPHVSEVASTFHEVTSALGAFAEAEPIFRDAYRRYPANKKLAYFLVDVLIQQEKYRESMSVIETCMATFGVEDGILTPALKVRAKLGSRAIKPVKSTTSSISLCMIIKNEERHLAKCLESVKKAVDDIIIVDTGSTDRSADIARAFGAEVYTCMWQNDFSYARNISLSKANGQWILILDADEIIAQRDHEQLLKVVRKAHTSPVAFKFITRNYTKDVGAEGWQANNDEYPGEAAGNGWYPSEKIRLFPRDSRIRFENAIHELVETSVRRVGIPIVKCVIPIHHYGTLDRKKDAEKKADYFTLGKEKIADSSEDPVAIIENAIQAQEVGEYKRALILWEAVLSQCPLLPLAHFNLSFVYIQLEQYNQAHDAACKAMELDPNLKEAVLNYALCLIRIGNIKRAAERLEEFLVGSPNHPMGKGLLAVAWCILGKRRDGLKLLHELREMGFDCSNYILDHARKMAAAGRKLEAGKLLQAIADSPYAGDKE